MCKLQVFVLCLEIVFVLSTRHEKPVHKTLWPQHCTRNSYALNDCNWCWCNKQNVFACSARVCGSVDMFGHFNDAIQDIDVGMEGHGVWRTKETACEPGVQYRRDNLICICSDDGSWPNPICRDTLRIMHAVEVADSYQKSKKCVATKLYVVGCNVCYCPATGQMDLQQCTNRNCTEDDPVLHNNKEEPSTEIADVEYYANCNPDHMYKIGCKQCKCHRNNRLLCDNCTEMSSPKVDEGKADEGSHYCSNTKPGEVFALGCNFCFCDRKHVIYCTTKQCIKGPKKYEIGPSLFKIYNLVTVTAPYDDVECTPGTKYKKGCNECYCSRTAEGKKVYTCTVQECPEDNTALDEIKANCVEGQVYYLNCQICRCDVVDEIKRETCTLDTKCTGSKAMKEPRLLELRSMRGYCEPYHKYEKDCNTCRCLADGKVVECTPNICNDDAKEAVIVDLLPVTQNDGEACPKDHMYKVDCNICFCLSNGNVLCTTIDCKKEV